MDDTQALPPIAKRDDRVTMSFVGSVSLANENTVWIQIRDDARDLMIDRDQWDAITDKTVAGPVPRWQAGDMVTFYSRDYRLDILLRRDADGNWFDGTRTTYKNEDRRAFADDTKVNTIHDKGELTILAAEGRVVITEAEVAGAGEIPHKFLSGGHAVDGEPTCWHDYGTDIEQVCGAIEADPLHHKEN